MGSPGARRRIDTPTARFSIVSGRSPIPPTTLEGKLYCCPIKDVCSNRIVGYSIDERMTAKLATSALRAAIARWQRSGTVVVHSIEVPSSGRARTA